MRHWRVMMMVMMSHIGYRYHYTSSEFKPSRYSQQETILLLFYIAILRQTLCVYDAKQYYTSCSSSNSSINHCFSIHLLALLPWPSAFFFLLLIQWVSEWVSEWMSDILLHSSFRIIIRHQIAKHTHTHTHICRYYVGPIIHLWIVSVPSSGPQKHKYYLC